MVRRLLKMVPMLALLCCAHGAPGGSWLGGVGFSEAEAATIQLPRTGQTGCWDVNGNSVACAGTGQDGDKLKGVPAPNPRFTDNANGTVTDNQTGLIWLQNANCTNTAGGIAKTNEYLNWTDALSWSNGLASGACALSDGTVAGDWRLPNRKELQSLIDRQNSYPALPTGHPFNNVQAYYWSSSSYAYVTGIAWYVYMVDGFVYGSVKTYSSYVWPVRAGQLGHSVISLSPSGKDFGISATGTTTTGQTFTIGNTGSTLIVSGVATTGGDSGMFTIAPGDGTGGTCGSLKPTIANGASCTISVAFAPASAGAKATTLRIASNDPGTPNKDVALTGTGVLPTFTIGTGVNGSGVIACTPSATVNQGDSTTCTATPDSGNYVAAVTVDSVSVPAAANTAVYSQPFNAVTASHAMSATFSAKANQNIAFTPATKSYGDAPLDLSTLATGGGSGNPVTFVLVSGPGGLGSANNAILTITGVGNITVRASQAGSATHNAAANVEQTIAVNKATAGVTLGSLSATYDGTAKSASATTNPVGKTVTFTYDGSTTVPTRAGSYAVVGTISDSNYQGTANGTLTIAKATLSITWNRPAAITQGTALSAAQLNAGTSVPGTFVYSPALGSVPSVGTQTLSVTFTPTDTIDYATATATVSLTVNPQTFTVTPNAGTGGGISPSAPQNVNSNATTSFTITPTSGYQIASVTGCGGNLSGTTYTTGAITGNCIVAVSYSAVTQPRDGIVNPATGKTAPDISDALKVLKHVMGITLLSDAEKAHADIAPLGANGVPVGKGYVDVGDVVLILRRVIGAVTW